MIITRIVPYFGVKPSGLTSEYTLTLASEHLARYGRLVKRGQEGDRNVCLSEAQDLLRTWQGIEHKEGDWELLTPFERGELVDAWTEIQVEGELP